MTLPVRSHPALPVRSSAAAARKALSRCEELALLGLPSTTRPRKTGSRLPDARSRHAPSGLDLAAEIEGELVTRVVGEHGVQVTARDDLVAGEQGELGTQQI